jgi:hypothetical protein
VSTYEEDVRSALKDDFAAGHISEADDSEQVFKELGKTYPVVGSKIDWDKIPGSVVDFEGCAELQAEKFCEFFDGIRSKFELSGDVIYVGDSATDFSLLGSIDAIRRRLPDLLEVPQHHYFVGMGCSWCMCLTMEGDMGYGAQPK